MIGAPGSVRMPVIRPIGAIGGRRVYPQPAFGSETPRKEPTGKQPVRWLDRLGEYYEKLGVGGKIVFFLTVPGASVVILFMERKRLAALFNRWSR